MASDLQIPNWVAILIALIPAFAVFIYFGRAKGSMWLAFILGGAGAWRLALEAPTAPASFSDLWSRFYI
ncbi:MAG: hypothetical protein HXX80_06505 [Nitrososphaerales archaeon]|nr:hypothetical protein [Nitrososphaerales archaeon]